MEVMTVFGHQNTVRRKERGITIPCGMFPCFKPACCMFCGWSFMLGARRTGPGGRVGGPCPLPDLTAAEAARVKRALFASSE